MNRKIKVVEINGFKGMLVIAYAVICAVAGFVVFPAWMLMSLWNMLGTYVYHLPHMSLIHGFMLYAIFVLLYFATTSHKTCFGITSKTLSKSHISAMMKDIDDERKDNL